MRKPTVIEWLMNQLIVEFATDKKIKANKYYKILPHYQAIMKILREK